MVEAVTRACTVPKFRGSATYPQLQSCTSLPLCTVLQELGLYKLGIKLLKGTPIQNLHLHQKFQNTEAQTEQSTELRRLTVMNFTKQLPYTGLPLNLTEL
jgi:hypothetical protein